MARRRASTRFHRPSPRSNVWIGIDVGSSAVAGGTSVLLATLNAAGLLLRLFTIVRTRLRFLVKSDQVATTEEFRGVLGQIVISDQASAAGAASIPAPITESDGDWFTYEPFINRFEDATSVGFIQPSGTFISSDSKAMRKVLSN